MAFHVSSLRAVLPPVSVPEIFRSEAETCHSEFYQSFVPLSSNFRDRYHRTVRSRPSQNHDWE